MCLGPWILWIPLLDTDSCSGDFRAATAFTQHNTTAFTRHNTIAIIQHNITAFIQQNTTTFIQQNATAFLQHNTTAFTQHKTIAVIQHNTTLTHSIPSAELLRSARDMEKESAYLTFVKISQFPRPKPQCGKRSFHLRMTCSRPALNNNGLITSPCFTPRWMGKVFPFTSPIWLQYIAARSFKYGRDTPCDCKAPSDYEYSMRSNAFFKPNREIPFQRPAASTFQYHKGILYTCAWSESNLIFGLMPLQFWPQSLVLCKKMYVILSTAIGRQLLGESKLPPFGNIVKTAWLQLASKRPTASILLNTSRRHLCKSKLP